MEQNQAYRTCWCRIDTTPFHDGDGYDIDPELDLRRWANCQYPDIVKSGKYRLAFVVLKVEKGKPQGGNVAILSDLIENPDPEDCKTCPHYKFDSEIEGKNKIKPLN